MDEICVYAKPPVPGRTKSRLARDLGDEAAASLARAMLQDTLSAALAVPNARVSLWHPPVGRPEDFTGLAVHPAAYHRQSGRDLGERMADSFQRVLGSGVPRMLLLGSDCVSHSAGSLRRALGALTKVDVVLEPADDGGYVLVGQAGFCRDMFTDVPWGTEAVLSTTRRRLEAAGVSWQELPETFDVDRAADLPQVADYCRRHSRPHVKQWLAAHADLSRR